MLSWEKILSGGRNPCWRGNGNWISVWHPRITPSWHCRGMETLNLVAAPLYHGRKMRNSRIQPFILVPHGTQTVGWRLATAHPRPCRPAAGAGPRLPPARCCWCSPAAPRGAAGCGGREGTSAGWTVGSREEASTTMLWQAKALDFGTGDGNAFNQTDRNKCLS